MGLLILIYMDKVGEQIGILAAFCLIDKSGLN